MLLYVLLHALCRQSGTKGATSNCYLWHNLQQGPQPPASFALEAKSKWHSVVGTPRELLAPAPVHLVCPANTYEVARSSRHARAVVRLLQKLDMKRKRGSAQPGFSTVVLACCCKHTLLSNGSFFSQPSAGGGVCASARSAWLVIQSHKVKNSQVQ